MPRTARCVPSFCIGLIALQAPGLSQSAQERISAVPFTDVRITSGFWAPRLATNRDVTVPYT